MKFLYQLRVKIKGDHLEYSHTMRGCPDNHGLAAMLIKAKQQVADRHHVPLEDITLRVVSETPRAEHLMGGK